MAKVGFSTTPLWSNLDSGTRRRGVGGVLMDTCSGDDRKFTVSGGGGGGRGGGRGGRGGTPL